MNDPTKNHVGINIALTDRREPLNEAHDYIFGIFENYHCWQFHGSGVMRPFEIVGLIFFCTRMHHVYFFLDRQCASLIPIYIRKYRKYTIVVYTECASGFISSIRQFLDSYEETRLKNVSHVEAFYSYAILLVAD